MPRFDGSVDHGGGGHTDVCHAPAVARGRGQYPGRCPTVLGPILLVLALVAGLTGHGLMVARAQVQTAGATLTVPRGSAAVLREDGTPISPAGSGLTLGPGDQIATIGRSLALVTFFDGSEVELGGDTTIVLSDLGQPGRPRSITIQSVVGTTLHRVVTLTDQGAVYRVEAGGSVAMVRGTVFAHHRDASGDITVAVGTGDVEFPRQGMLLRRGEKRTETSRGDIVDSRFDPAMSLFTVVVEPASSGNPSGTDNPGLGTGSFTVPEQQSLQPVDDETDPKPAGVSGPGRTFLIAAAPSGTSRLEVASIDGFAIGDQIRVGSGPRAESGTVAGFGSILLAQPLSGSFGVGEPVVLVARATATATPSTNVGPIATIVQTPTATPTAPTPSATPTSAASPASPATATITPTASPTSTPTPSLTATPSPTPPFPCLGPLTREHATRGGGVTGTTRDTTAAGIRLTVYVQVEDAMPNTRFDVHVDVSGGSAGAHVLVGDFTTDGVGNATFTGTIVVPAVAATIDNEVVLHGDSPSGHQYIRSLFAPCSE